MESPDNLSVRPVSSQRDGHDFNPILSRRLDAADAAVEEISAALRSLRAAHRVQPDQLPWLGKALGACVMAGVAAAEHRRKLLDEAGM